MHIHDPVLKVHPKDERQTFIIKAARTLGGPYMFGELIVDTRGGELGEPGEPDGSPLFWKMICNFQ